MEVEVTIAGNTVGWYISKGYNIPIRKVQNYYINNSGDKKKNGTKYSFEEGLKIKVKIEDLPKGSNKIINFICIECNKECSCIASTYIKKKVINRCKDCDILISNGARSHRYWINKLIIFNKEAKCDISGESDKRFLVLHHLKNKNDGGKNEESNYVILSANYHTAYHIWNGGFKIPCNSESYYKFKQKELENLNKIK